MDRTAIVVGGKQAAALTVVRELARAGFEVVEAADAAEGWRAFRRISPALVMSLAEARGVEGLRLLRRVRSVSEVPVILFSERGDVRTAVSAIRDGASEFFELPADQDRMRRDVEEIARSAGDGGSMPAGTFEIAGESEAVRCLRQRVYALAPLSVSVLVRGEAGSGRDHVVRALHARSRRSEVELEKIRHDDPLARERPEDGAAIYLDEIERFKPELHAHWFAVLCDAAEREGGPRIYASTSEDLERLVREGEFHPGLADRLRRFEVPIPSLRERREDVGPIANALANRIGRRMKGSEVRIERAAVALLRNASWTGNVGELERVVEKLVAFSIGGRIEAQRVREVLGEAPHGVAFMRRKRREQEREELVALLESCGGNLAEVARRLELSRGAVIYRAQKFGLLPRARVARRRPRRRGDEARG